jgi:hypothetical protein
MPWLAVVGLFVWQFMATKNALATTRVESPLPPDVVAAKISNTFGGARSMLWANGAGPGSINMRRRGKDGGITMSINIEPSASGGSVVDMWASSYNEHFIFFANFAGSVNSKKKAIARQLVA